MRLSPEEIPNFLKRIEQEHNNIKKSIIYFATNCSDYITLSEAFSLPYKDRQLMYKVAEERYKKLQENSK